MTDRAYTVKELDALRSTVRDKYLWGSYHGCSNHSSASRSYNEIDMNKMVEELVRTHMLAGHTAEDLLESENA